MLEGTSIEDIEQRLDMLIENREALPESDSTLNSAEENPLKMLTDGENSGIIETGGKIEGGKNTDENWMQYEEFDRQAALFYDARVKDSDADIVAISKNTGLSYDDIVAVKNHIMVEEHHFSDGTKRKFDPSIGVAKANERRTNRN